MNVGASSQAAARIAQSSEELGKVLQNAQAKTLDQQKKLMELSVKTAVSADPAVGNNLNVTA